MGALGKSFMLLAAGCLFGGTFICSTVCADTVILKQGQTLTGEILADRSTHIYFDIGLEVLTIPKTGILEYEYGGDDGEQQIVAGKSAEVAPSVRLSGRLYKTANLKKTTIEECVERVSEAVVKVSSPAGIGSGFVLNEDGYLITNYHVIEK